MEASDGWTQTDVNQVANVGPLGFLDVLAYEQVEEGGTMTDNALTLTNNSMAIMPVMDIMQAMVRRQAVIDFVKSIMVEGNHYGKIPGTDKSTLLKPGAEMLTSFFGLAPMFDDVMATEDWTGQDHGGEPFFYYRQRCKLYRGDSLVAAADGSCNSWEKKYRYRSAERACPNCDKPTIRKSKYPPRNNPNAKPGWYCYAKDGGCGAEFADNDPAIKGQELGKVPNPDVAEQVNTILKMAQKRALIAATLIAVNASEFFTQDVEDMNFGVIEGEFTIDPPRQSQPEKPSQAPVTRQPAPLPPVRPVPAGVNAETGGVMPPPPSEASREDLGNVESPVTIDPAKWELYRSRVADNPRSTVTTVCNAAAMTGAYKADSHAINAALKISDDLEKGTKLTKEDALRLFDRLIDRKRQPQQGTLLEPADVTGYSE